ncbi:hypothetical protein FBUS_03002 [Fasciolopsis buskii]|uniref:Uncharacterized protein n=1 Tax=Fasciolopsis buskii TaxID=27845 RepID=A0A8E0RZB3_9TREM|nr:hypothetical protein FBUS_03002 [Fasciolopsis buski]
MKGGHQNCRHGRRRNLTRQAYFMCEVCGEQTAWWASRVLLLDDENYRHNRRQYASLIQRILGFHSDGSVGQSSMDSGKQFAVKTASAAARENMNGFRLGLSVANHSLRSRLARNCAFPTGCLLPCPGH